MRDIISLLRDDERSEWGICNAAANRIEADAAEIAALRAELARTNERWEKSHQIALAIQDERDALRVEVAGLRKFASDMRYWHHEYTEGLISAETLSTYVGMVIGEYDAAARKGEA